MEHLPLEQLPESGGPYLITAAFLAADRISASLPSTHTPGNDWARSCSTGRMSFGIYLGGIVLVIGGLVYGAAILHTPVPWIVVGALVLLGLGMLLAVKATRSKDLPR